MKFPSYFTKRPKQFLYAVILKTAKCIPDKLFLKLQYRLLMGRKLDLRHPKYFTEKIQWLKIHNRKPIMTKLVDKFAVKEYVAEKIGKQFIIPTIGVWNSFDEIDWNMLPEKFAIKTTHGGGGTGTVIVHDKAKTDLLTIKSKLLWSYNRDDYSETREWPYKNVPRRIIAEELIEIPEKADLTDYKIFCFNGKPKYIQVIQDRHSCETIDFFDIQWKHQHFIGLNPKAKNASTPIARPQNLEDMLWAAEQLASGFDFVRVDMYQGGEKALFGEITFFPASGIGAFTPKEYDGILGELLHLSS